MKLQLIMNRGAEKEGTDLLDIIRLSLDPVAGPVSRTQLAGAHPQIRTDAAPHARRWFNDHANRSLRRVRGIPEGRDTELDDLHLVGELLLAVLSGPEARAAVEAMMHRNGGVEDWRDLTTLSAQTHDREDVQ